MQGFHYRKLKLLLPRHLLRRFGCHFKCYFSYIHFATSSKEISTSGSNYKTVITAYHKGSRCTCSMSKRSAATETEKQLCSPKNFSKSIIWYKCMLRYTITVEVNFTVSFLKL